MGMIEGLRAQEKEVDSTREKLYQIAMNRVQSYGHYKKERTSRVNFRSSVPIEKQTSKTAHQSRQSTFSKQRQINEISTEKYSRVQLYKNISNDRSHKKNKKVNNT